MDFSHLLLLAAIQGLTEFLPVSSSGHLTLVHSLLPFGTDALRLDVALHGGTLLAIMLYFHRDMLSLWRGSWHILRGAPLSPHKAAHKTAEARFATLIIIASLPVLIIGGVLFFTDAISLLRVGEVVAWANIIFAVPLWAADKWARTTRTHASLTPREGLLIGMAQVFALIPGASRAGVTLMAARALGLSRAEAARFAMVLSVPVIAAFTLVQFALLLLEGNQPALAMSLWAAAASAGFAFLSIHIFMWMMARLTLLPFVLYRLALGGVLLYVLY